MCYVKGHADKASTIFAQLPIPQTLSSGAI
jgi:hypothetical protein